MSDDLVFSDELPPTARSADQVPWQVLVVDDDPAVHEVTKLVMVGFEMDARPLQFTHCYSAVEAHAVLSQPNDFALMLLDVVMESEHAGLDLVRQIREELGNRNVRIVLRTGQPGQAPEEQVIKDYDINDYKEKTDLTRRRLITVFYAALRGYRDLMRIEHARLGLRRSIEAITQVGDSSNLRNFASAVLEQVNYLLDLNGEGLCASRMSAYTANSANGNLRVLAATEAYAQLMVGKDVGNLPPEVAAALEQVLRDKCSHHGERHYVGYFRTKAGNENMIYMKFSQTLQDSARELLELFSRNVAITYDGLLMREDIHDAQRSTIEILGGAIERRSSQPQRHLRRIGEIAALLARARGACEQEVTRIRMAATLHDVGKATIADHLLTKPGPLSDDEWTTMQTHAASGHTLLSGTDAQHNNLGAQAALEHHEHWNGKGYPQGLRGHSISLVGRIAAIADVLDALVSANSYKSAWPLQEALDYIHARSGTQFDPDLVALLNTKRQAVEEIYNTPTLPIAPTLAHIPVASAPAQRLP